MRFVTDVPQSSPSRSALPACFGVVAALAGNIFAQSAVSLPQDAPFYKEPGGVRLGTILSGTRVTPTSRNGGFSQITLDAWIYTASTEPDRREGFDLSVSVSPGENLRANPGGTILARAVQGALLNRVSTDGGWTRVRRTVWIRSLTPRRQDVTTSSAFVAQVPSDSSSRRAAETPRRPEAPSRRDDQTSSQAPSRRDAETSVRATLRSGTNIQRDPDGPAIAKIAGPTEVALRETNGEWVKVQVEGWVRRAEVDSSVTPRPAITAAMLRENPDRYVGQTVEWRVQFLALQQADDLRPEMPLGQPYLLVRGPMPESGFAYVTISRAQVVEFRSLKPLEELVLSVTIRAGRSRYLATPVVELVRRMP
jgi:hypothetical protein